MHIVHLPCPLVEIFHVQETNESARTCLRLALSFGVLSIFTFWMFELIQVRDVEGSGDVLEYGHEAEQEAAEKAADSA